MTTVKFQTTMDINFVVVHNGTENDHATPTFSTGDLSDTN